MSNSTTAQPAGRSLSRTLRIIVCVLTAGFVFPNVLIENMSPTPVVSELEEQKR